MWEKESLKSEENPLAPYNLTEKRSIRSYLGRESVSGDLRFQGRLLGGCLDCLVNLLGTRFDRTREFVERYQEDGIVWFLEACDLNVFAIRRAMWQLEEAGWFEHVKGFLIGRPANGEPMMGLDAYGAVLEVAGRKDVPVVMDVDLGHLPPMMPIVVGSMAEEGELTLTVSGKGLEPAVLNLRAVKAAGDFVEKSFLEDYSAKRKAELPARIPVRKLELRAEGSHVLTPDRQEVMLEALLYPADTTDRTLVWKVVNAGGIEVNYAEISGYIDEQGRNLARVKAVGDGEFYVRCTVKHGERAALISQLEYRGEGLGSASLNPYEFITAGLYTRAIGEITSGNEKGIATARDGASGVVFSSVDFGEYGSDEITLPVFALSGDRYQIDIWAGTPYEEGSRLIDSVFYQKPSVWNVYQEQTYKLPERLRGMTDIGFVLFDKVHVKGFVFRRQEKAFGKLYAGEANAVYGDTFTRDGNIVRGIGNNVSVVFENMDFGERGAERVTVWGRTPLTANTIHIHFTDESGETVNRILEFAGNGGASQTFSI